MRVVLGPGRRPVRSPRGVGRFCVICSVSSACAKSYCDDIVNHHSLTFDTRTRQKSINDPACRKRPLRAGDSEGGTEMKVFVAAASGAIGRRLVPLLVARGHEVVAMTRSEAHDRGLREAGAEPVVADGLDRASVVQAVMRAEPEVVVHEMTALAGMDEPEAVRRGVRDDEPPAHRGNRSPARGRAQVGHPPGRRPELRELGLRAHRRPGQDRR